MYVSTCFLSCWLILYICVLVILQYYALDITYFKSSLDCHLLDLLWNKYWVNTLSSSPLLGNGDYVAGQISDLGKVARAPKFQSQYELIFLYLLLNKLIMFVPFYSFTHS